MNLETEIVSKEMIKPSSPTPNHLRHYKLSLLDQISPPVYNPMVLFYPNQEDKFKNVENYSNQLKKSLSQVLTHFYPLAGRIKDNLFVDCNDEGALYSQAKVISCKLADVLENPQPTEFQKLLPFELDKDQELLLGVQLNVFDCGGICISLCVSHKIADGLSTFMFMKTWAAVSSGKEDQIIKPEFESATLFPPMNNLLGYNPRIGIVEENVAAKIFVFSSSSIRSLQAKYGLKTQKLPSRIEALSVFIWTRFMAAARKVESLSAESARRATYLMLHAVNLRTRMKPPLKDESFGNFYRVAITNPSDKEELVTQMRDSVSKIDEDYVKKLQDQGDEHMIFLTEMAEIFLTGEMETLNFTSLCRFPLYDSDFGWGKPVWVGSPSLTFKNLVVFMDNASGDGVEALVHLKEEDMDKFKEDQELLQLVNC